MVGNTARAGSGIGAVDLAVDLGDMEPVKERLRSLRMERERLAGELTQARKTLPSVKDLMSPVRQKLDEIETTLLADVAQGRLAPGSAT